MWPLNLFKRKPKPTGFTDTDGVYKIRLDPNHDRSEAMFFASVLDTIEQRNGRTPHHVAKQQMIDDYAKRGEPVPAEWLDPTIGTFRNDSNGQPAKYPSWENRG